MQGLTPVSAPGLAVIPAYLSDEPVTIKLKGSKFSKSLRATTSDGIVLFHSETKKWSLSHRTALLDMGGQKLFEIRKQGNEARRHYAEVSNGGARLLEIETRPKCFGRAHTTVKFVNQADQNKPLINLDFVRTGSSGNGDLMWAAKAVVGRVEKIGWCSSKAFRLTVAPGVDPTLVVALTIANIDQARTQNNAAAVGGVATSGS